MQKKLSIILVLIWCLIGWYVWQFISLVWEGSPTPYGSIILSDTRGVILTNKWLRWGYMMPYTGTIEWRLIDAILTVEDKRYYNHAGLDWRAKLSWIWENVQAGGIVRWSSTLTEQYIKNRYFRESPRTIPQKLREAILAIWIEEKYTKEEILRMYLDNIFFGYNTYGLAGAMELYFPHNTIDTLSDDDILDIITRIHTPSIRATNLEQALIYREHAAQKLWWQAWSSGIWDDYSRNTLDTYPFITQRVQQSKELYCNWDISQLVKWTQSIADDICSSTSIDLQLTISAELQSYITSIIQNTIIRIEWENVTGSAVYIYNPTEWKVLAYVGNRWVRSDDADIDMITRRRSVGSILKPFIYLLALRDGWEIENYILDDTREYPTWVDGRVFIPKNYNPKSYGPIKLREALGNSLNSATVRISESIGIGRIYSFFENIGLILDHDAGYYWYGISLGAVELSLENIVESYSALVDMNDPDVYLIRQVLSESKNRARTFGISSILNSSLILPVKTGTSTDFRDNWTVSYHRDAIIWVWVGNTDASPMEDVSWVSGAWPIWHSIAEYMISRGVIQPWNTPIPSGLTEAYICLDTKCIRKERTYMKKPGSIESRPLDNIYSLRDFIGWITDDEQWRWNIR